MQARILSQLLLAEALILAVSADAAPQGRKFMRYGHRAKIALRPDKLYTLKVCIC